MASKPKNIAGSTLLKEGMGKLTGFFVASGTTPTLKFWDNTAASGTVLINTFTPPIATQVNFPDVTFSTGLFVTTGGTIDVTIFFE